MFRALRAFWVLALALAGCSMAAAQHAQPFAGLGMKPAAQKTLAVQYLFPEQVALTPGKPTTVELHFRVAPGFHINSHSPLGEGMIPTTLMLPENSPIRLVKAAFPSGTDFSLPLAPAEKLSVYTGEFVVRVQLLAPAGERLVEASLRYQACDNNACMPPHTIPVVFDVVAR